MTLGLLRRLAILRELIMPDTFAITVVFIVLAAAVGAFIRRRTRDKCLKDFADCMITLEESTGKSI